jgi:hypothetical protein
MMEGTLLPCVVGSIRSLFRNWEQHPEGYKDSESHYRAKMEQIIETYKSNLE